MTRTRCGTLVVATLTIVAIIGNCTDGLAPTADLAASISEAGQWPDTLSVAELATIAAQVTDAAGATILGLDLEWATSDSSVLTIARIPAPIPATSEEQLAAGLRAIVTTHRAGSATIIARVARDGLVATELRLPVVVKPNVVPALFTVSKVDTLNIAIDKADSAVLHGATVEWQTTDPAVLAIASLNSDHPYSALLTPRRSGPVQITATVTGARVGRSVFQFSFGVGAIKVDTASQWPAAVTVGDTTTLRVRVRDALDQPMAQVPVRWTSTNGNAVEITPRGGPDAAGFASAFIRALRSGGTEIVTTVGDPNLQTSERRAAISVGTVLVTEAQNWPDTLTVSDVVALSVIVKDAAGQIRSNARVRWSSTNTVAFTVDSISGIVTALSGGGGQVVATVGEPGVEQSEHRATIAVFPFRLVETTPWPSVIYQDNDYALGVTVLDAFGKPRVGLPLRWRSTNEAAFKVDSILGTLRAVSLFSGEVVATAGVAPFQSSELRRVVSVFQRWLSVDAGRAHTCARAFPVGTGFCWGSDQFGELGIGSFSGVDVSQPARIATLLRFDELVAGGIELNGLAESHTCGRAGRTVQCWGSIRSGQLGDGSFGCIGSFACPTQTTQPTPVTTIDNGLVAGNATAVPTIASLVVGGRHGCVVLRVPMFTDALTCWGMITPGFPPPTMGFGTAPNSSTVLSLVPLIDVSAGGEHVCSIPLNPGPRTIFCLGNNDLGQLGSGTPGPGFIMATTEVLDNLGQTLEGSFSAGGKHTCVIRSTGRVWCWGSNSKGQLGSAGGVACTGGVQCSTRAIEVSGSMTFTSIAAGFEHTCALTPSGVAYCWGSNSDGQLGNGAVGGSSATPVAVSGGLSFASITAGGAHTCGITTEGGLYCWGRNVNGQVGSGRFGGDTSMPVRVANPPIGQ